MITEVYYTNGLATDPVCAAGATDGVFLFGFQSGPPALFTLTFQVANGTEATWAYGNATLSQSTVSIQNGEATVASGLNAMPLGPSYAPEYLSSDAGVVEYGVPMEVPATVTVTAMVACSNPYPPVGLCPGSTATYGIGVAAMVTPTPEPSSVILASVGLLGVMAYRGRRIV